MARVANFVPGARGYHRCSMLLFIFQAEAASEDGGLQTHSSMGRMWGYKHPLNLACKSSKSHCRGLDSWSKVPV